ncbi:nuclear transcription factor Y subunit alpha-like [Belonocnema kinseyi]|uniref:nuclear transcription factor Y subunit alpha-like n=1 Tax=Belonocnema kinseyi TaxID=2817044 RepID=UPI00143DED79|nr:nuclear transcription factor Y subunit alpha-like [Belonocnema kinseyi]
MKIVILLFAYVALLRFSSGALNNRQQHDPNQGLASLHPFYIPPASIIFIRRMRNGVNIPGHAVYGTLHHVPDHYLPADSNVPFGHAFVKIEEDNTFYARLMNDTRANNRNNNNNNRIHNRNNAIHNINNRNNNANNAPNEVPEYDCYIRRPPHRDLTATLFPVHEDGYENDHLPHVHYMDSGDINVVGELTR